MVDDLGDLKRDLVADDLVGDPAADRVGAPELAVGVVDQRIIGEGRDDRVFVERVDGGDVLGDDSVKLGGGALTSLLVMVFEPPPGRRGNRGCGLPTGESRAGFALTLPQREGRYSGDSTPRHHRRFLAASHLSVKTLRHYHDVGLLEPSEVDPGNGYRYYAATDPVAQVIRRLRGLQMPVAEVKSVLAARDPEARNELIVAHLDRLEADLARTRAAVLELRGLLERPVAPRAVEQRTVPPTAAIAIHATVDREDLLVWWQGALTPPLPA